MTTPEPSPAWKFDWQRLILSLDIPTVTKAVALALSIYASKDGSNCHPGTRRLAWAISADEKTVRRHLAVLRDELRLIERTFWGSHAGRRGLSDTYQLVIPWDLAARVKIRDYEPEHRTPESADKQSENTGTPDSGTGTPDSGARTADTGVHPPGSNHQVVISPPADSIVAPLPSSHTEVEVPPARSGQDRNQSENDERNRQLAALEAMMRETAS